MKQGGLLPPTHDRKKDFQFGQIFSVPKLSELPTEFILEGWKIKHQGDTDYCTAFSSCGASELQEGVELSPEWAFAKSKDISGDPEAFGQTLQNALKVHTKFGAIEQTESPYSLADKGDSFLRVYLNWPKDLEQKALKHKKQTYISVTGPYDPFDDARACLYKFKDEKRAILIGVIFSWDLKQKIFDTYNTQGFGHAMSVVGYKVIDGKQYLVIANSYGKESGDNGYHYMTREVYNYFADIYGAYMVVDMPREDIENMINKGIKEGDTLADKIIKNLVYLIKSIFTSPFLSTEDKSKLITDISNNLPKVKKPIPELPKRDLVYEFCKAIESMEGFYPGSRSYRNNNSGNLKYAGQKKAVGKDDKGFAIFPTYRDGFEALKNMIIYAASGKSKVYKPTFTFLQFFAIYAPSHDNNDPNNYANVVAKRLNMPVTTQIKDLLA